MCILLPRRIRCKNLKLGQNIIYDKISTCFTDNPHVSFRNTLFYVLNLYSEGIRYKTTKKYKPSEGVFTPQKIARLTRLLKQDPENRFVPDFEILMWFENVALLKEEYFSYSHDKKGFKPDENSSSSITMVCA